MGFRSKGKDPKVVQAEEAAKAAEVAVANEAPAMADLLAMEDVARSLADNYPDGPNCDAAKAALRNAAHGIAHVRKVLAHNARIA